MSEIKNVSITMSEISKSEESHMFVVTVHTPFAVTALEDLGAQGKLPSKYQYLVELQRSFRADGSELCGVVSIKNK